MGRVPQVQKRLAAVAVLLLLSGCVSQTVRVVDMTPPQQSERYLEESELLDVGIAIFDENVPEDYDERIENVIMPEVRRAESQYIPYFAKNLLQSTGNWGAVRVVPRETHAVDVMVTGRILSSNGESMIIAASKRCAPGAVWFNKEYSALASKYAYEASDAAGTLTRFKRSTSSSRMTCWPTGDIEPHRRAHSQDCRAQIRAGIFQEAFAEHVSTTRAR